MNSSDASAAIRGFGGEQPEIGVDLRRGAVVVAGADVDVALNRVTLLADDEAQLAVCFQVHEPVDDVHAGLFEPCRPADIAALVESGFQLDEHGDLLARLRGSHQPLHERRFVADAVERHLDRDDMFVVDGRIEKGLERRKRVERMVEQRVAIFDVLENAVSVLAVPDHARHERRVFQFRPLDACQCHPVGEAQPRGRAQHDLALDLEILDQNVEHPRRHIRVDLQQRQRAVPDFAKTLVDRLEQIDRLLFLQHDVCFANHAEQMRIDHLDAWKQLAEVQRITSSSSAKVRPRLPVSCGGTGTKRGSTSGTFTLANRVRPSPLTTTAKFLLRFEMYGKGCPGSKARGVRTGHTLWLK